MTSTRTLCDGLCMGVRMIRPTDDDVSLWEQACGVQLPADLRRQLLDGSFDVAVPDAETNVHPTTGGEQAMTSPGWHFATAYRAECTRLRAERDELIAALKCMSARAEHEWRESSSGPHNRAVTDPDILAARALLARLNHERNADAIERAVNAGALDITLPEGMRVEPRRTKDKP